MNDRLRQLHQQFQAVLLNSEENPHRVLDAALHACAEFALCEGLEQDWHRDAAEALDDAESGMGVRNR